MGKSGRDYRNGDKKDHRKGGNASNKRAWMEQDDENAPIPMPSRRPMNHGRPMNHTPRKAA